jgi:CBS domain-containing protein
MDVADILSARRIGAVVVMDRDQKVAGIISERDIIRIIGSDGVSALHWPVGNAMTRRVETCRERDSVRDLMTRMTDLRVRHLPVIENDRLVGIISIGDVVKHHIAEVEQDADAMRDYITHV